MSVTIYHNPKCSKSRATLALLHEKGVEPDVIEYLTNPPSATQLKDILKKLGKAPADILRKKEAAEEGVDGGQSDDALIKDIVTHPRVMERPIVVRGAKAAIGRPPENVLTIL